MSVIERLRIAVRSAPSVGEPRLALGIPLVDDTHRFEGEDGDTIWCGGYVPIDNDGEPIHGVNFEIGNVFCCKIAGAHYRPAALASRRFAPGSKIVLRPEPQNPHDPNAVGIWDASGRLQVGYVPAEMSARVAAALHEGVDLHGQVLREFRHHSRRGERIALHAIIAPVVRGHSADS